MIQPPEPEVQPDQKELDQEELDREQLEEEVSRGYLKSPFDEHPGYIQFPYPMMLHHISEWWSMAVEANKDVNRKTYKFHETQWHAYRHMLTEYDGWHIHDIAVGDVKADRVPAILVSFVLSLGEQYVLNQLSPKQVAVLRTLL